MSKEAIENLRQHQQQLDADGSFVGVSRQALEEALDFIALLEKANETMRVGLDKLARFGNEPYLGNSKGNDIAIDALRAAGYEAGV